MRRSQVISLALAAAVVPAAPAAAGTAVAADRAEIAIVKSESLAPYVRFIAGFSAESRAEVVEYDLRGAEDRVDKVFGALKAKPPALVLAVGPLAANGARQTMTEVPVIFAMVPNYEKYGLEARNVTGIALTPGCRVQLKAVTSVAPKVKRVGVVYNPKYSQAVVDGASADATGMGIAVVGAKVEAGQDVAAGLRSLAGKVDALWMLADKTVATEAAAKKILAFALEQRLPLLALSESLVKEGALFSLSPNALAIGQQAGRLANRIVFEKIDPGALAVQMPEGLDVAVNLATARRLGVECEVGGAVLRFAAKNGYAVKAYE